MKLLNQGGSGGGSGSSPLTTKGDIYTYTSADARLGVGTNGQFLSADSTAPTGLKWVTASGTGDMLAATYDPANIAQQLVGTTATQTLTNKTLGNTNTVTLKDTLFSIQDDGDATKILAFQLSGITTGNTRTLTIQDASGTIALTSNKLSVFAATTSAELAGIISDESGSGALVFANTPTLVTPVLGVATATSINKVVITAPATAATLTLADGSSLVTSGANSITLTSGGPTNVTLPTTGTLATLAGSETLSNKTLTAPKIANAGFIADANGNELIIFTTTASAVNEITYANAATGANPKFSATGGDANVGIDFQGKGSGVYRFLGTSTQAAELRLLEDTDDGSNYTAFKVGTQAGNITYVLPTALGSAGYTLTDAAGDGILSWAAAGSGANTALSNIASVNMPVDTVLGFGTTTAFGGTEWNTTQTVDTMMLLTGSTSNAYVLAERADRAFDFAHAQQTNPTLFIHSAAQSTSQYISLFHDGTSGVLNQGGPYHLDIISSGVNRIRLDAAGGQVFTPNTANGTYVKLNITVIGGVSDQITWDTLSTRFAFAGADTASPADHIMFFGQGGSGTNIAAKDAVYAAGSSTGNAAPANHKMQTTVPNASGTTSQTLGDRLAIVGKYTTITESSATAFASVTVGTGTVAGGVIEYTVEANDATDFQALTGIVPYSIVNKAGTLTMVLGTDQQASSCSTGTLTGTITMVDATGGVMQFKMNAVSSLTQTVLRINCHVRKNFGIGSISSI